MLYGVIASVRRQAAAEAPWLPAGALVYLDFIEGNYYGAGVKPISLLLGGGLDIGDIDANGMAVWHTNSNRPTATGVFAEAIEAGLAAGLTVIFEIDWDGGAGSGLLSISDSSDFNGAGFNLETYTGSGLDANVTMSDYDTLDLQDNFPSFLDPGINRLGMTFSRDIGGGSYRYAASVNGDAAITQDVTYSAEVNFPTVGKIAIGHIDDFSTAFDAAYIRSITVYPAVDETELAALTAIPTA